MKTEKAIQVLRDYNLWRIATAEIISILKIGLHGFFGIWAMTYVLMVVKQPSPPWKEVSHES